MPRKKPITISHWTSFMSQKLDLIVRRLKPIWILFPVLALALFLFLSLHFSLASDQPAGSSTVWLPIVTKTNSNPIQQGIATYYYATGDGACLFGPSPNDLMVAAMNAEEYDNAAYCGAYVHVTGPEGAVVVRIVDLCPGCEAGHLDLSLQAFDQIADVSQGSVSITWQLVSPELSGPIAYHFKDGSNQWWTAVQIRNHRNPIAKFEYQTDGGQWVTVPRTSYNYFVEASGMGPGPYSFRVTDSYGNVLTDNSIAHIENGTVNGANQFPPGP
jgi:expansin (peptidoglycan-binding protein)